MKGDDQRDAEARGGGNDLSAARSEVSVDQLDSMMTDERRQLGIMARE